LVVTLVEVELAKDSCTIQIADDFLDRWGDVAFTLTAMLARRMSTHTRTFPGDLGFAATTMGDTQGVGPSTRSITPSFSS
jgi:hypothetical protein